MQLDYRDAAAVKAAGDAPEEETPAPQPATISTRLARAAVRITE
jgi:hypothetical protein